MAHCVVGPESPERKSFCWLPNLDGAILFIYCCILFFSVICSCNNPSATIFNYLKTKK